MKKPLFIIIILIVVSEFTALWGQTNPTYEAKLMNDFKVSANEYEFDIYIKSTGLETLEVFGFQVALLLDDNIRNGGSMIATYIQGTSEMYSEQVPSDPNINSVVEGIRVFKLAAKTVMNPGEGTIISKENNGTRLGRFRISTTASAFETSPANINWTFDQTTYGYSTKFLAWVADEGPYLPVDVTAKDNHLNELNNLPLPVEFSSFTATTMGQEVILKWKTESELNTRLFEVERQTFLKDQSTEWELIGNVLASGTSINAKEYSYSDRKLMSDKYNYRIKVIDNDGTFKYSNIVEVQIEVPKEYALSQNYPNPFNPVTRIDYQLPVDSKVMIELYAITGEKVITLVDKDLSAGYYILEIKVDELHLASGVYMIRMSARDLTNQYLKTITITKKLTITK